MPTYRPSMIAKFILTFDESMTIAQPAGAPTTPLVAASQATSDDAPPALQLGNASHVAARVPTDCNVELPGYRQASKFSMKLQFRDLPIDPRTVRAAAVEIHLGTVPADRFAQGYRLGNDPTKPMQAVLHPVSSGGTPNTETLLGVFTVDEWEVTHGTDGSFVSMSGRDLRGILLDTPINGDLKDAGAQRLADIDTSKPINEVVTQILAMNRFFVGFTVVANAAEWPKGVIPSPASEDLIPRHAKGAKGDKSGAVASTAQGTSGIDGMKFWDLIVQLCYFVGAIPYMEGTRLIIRPARSIYERTTGPVDPVRNPTPFVGGRPRTQDAQNTAAITPPLRIRRLVYGRDLSSYTLQRKFSGWRRPKYVRCTCFDPARKDVAVGIYPDPNDAEVITRMSPGGKISASEIVTIPVRNIIDEARLTEVARSLYEEMGRGELGGVCETSNLSSFGGDNADPDMLRLRPGSAIEALVDARRLREVSPLQSTYTDFERKSFGDQVAEIKQRIGDENLARVIVATARGSVTELQRFFRVQNVKFSWNVDSGVKINFDFENYIEVRSQIEPTNVAPESPTTVISSTDKPAQATTKGKSLRTAGGGS